MSINIPYTFSSTIKEQKSIQILILLAITTWISHFLYHTEFGLYEDDWYRIAPALSMTFSDLGNLIINNLTDLGASQGRPLHPILIYCLSSIAYKLGGLSIAYWFGAIIFTTNAFLFYILLRCLFQNQGFAILGALTFCLFPADTTQPFLTHSLGVQTSLTLLLIAIHCYISQKKYISYGVIFLSLMCYETVFPIFSIAPLLQHKWHKDKWHKDVIKKMLPHLLIMGMMVVGVVIIRRIFGEGNITKPNPHLILLFLSNPIIGPITAMAMFLYRPITALMSLPKEFWGLLFPYFGGLAWLLNRERLSSLSSLSVMTREDIEDKSIEHTQEASNQEAWWLSKIPEGFRDLTKPILLGLMMLVLAYPFTLTTTGLSVSGRGTRVHAAAVLGASILIASLGSIVIRLANNYGRQRLVVLGISGYLTLLLGFGLTVQQDYRMSWQHQQAFWTEAIALMPDITNETVVFLEPTGLRDTRQLLFLRKDLTGIPDSRQIKSLDFLYLVLPLIYNFPQQWQHPPRVYRLPKNWTESILTADNFLQTTSTEEDWSNLVEGTPRRKIKSSDVIFLETSNGKLTRRKEPLVLGEKVFKLKEQSASGLPTFGKTPIYSYLIRQPNEPPISYLLQ